MNNLPLVIGGAVGLLTLAIISVFAYRRLIRLRTSLTSQIQKAEKELIEDIESVGVNELQQTTAGRKLLIVYGRYKTKQLAIEGKELEAAATLRELHNLMTEEDEKEEIEAQLVLMDEQKHALIEQLRNLQETVALLNEAMATSTDPVENLKLKREIEKTKANLERVQKTLMAEKG